MHAMRRVHQSVRGCPPRCHTIGARGLEVRKLPGGQFLPFVALFDVTEGRMGVVVSFLAVMELIKESLIEIVQSEPFGPIHVKARGQDALEIDS